MGILPENGVWVGPPALYLKITNKEPILLDGNKRLNEVKKRGIKTTVPIYTARSHLEVIKHLIHNGHQERAANHAIRYAPELVQLSTGSLSILLEVGKNKLQPYVRALKSPSERHKLPRRAILVVRKLRSIHKNMIEGNPITIEDVEKALGEFIKE